MSETRTVLLIDLSSLYWQNWHASGNAELSTARTSTLSAVERCRSGAPDALVAICCDSGRSFRKDLLPEYKAQRPEKDHVSLAELAKVQDRLRADGYLLWSAPTFEADDLIATATARALAVDRHDVIVCSADKDLLQLVGPRVRQLRTHTWDLWDEAKVVEKFGVKPAALGDWLALVGDKSDNIQGARGVGPKTATELLTAHGNLRGIYSALFGGADGFKPSVKQSLADCSQAVELARKLVTLRDDVPIAFEEIYKERSQARLLPQENEMPDETEPFDAETGEVPPPPKPEKTPPPAPVAAETPSTALVPVTYNGPFELALEPKALNQALWLARGLFESRLYQRFQTPEAIFAIIIRGREMGLGALTSLDCFHVIEGKPSPQAHLLIARAKAHRDCEYFQCIETTETRATWRTKNRTNPEPTQLTYTIEQAQRAGLLAPSKSGRPSNWTTRPDELLRKTAGVQLARLEYPEALLGAYASEELET